MDDMRKTKKELVDELAQLRTQLTSTEGSARLSPSNQSDSFPAEYKATLLREIVENMGPVFWISELGNTLQPEYINPSYQRIWQRDPRELFDDVMHSANSPGMGSPMISIFE